MNMSVYIQVISDLYTFCLIVGSGSFFCVIGCVSMRIAVLYYAVGYRLCLGIPLCGSFIDWICDNVISVW